MANIKVTSNLINCKVDKTSFPSGESTEFTITANAGHEFTTETIISFKPNTGVARSYNITDHPDKFSENNTEFLHSTSYGSQVTTLTIGGTAYPTTPVDPPEITFVVTETVTGATTNRPDGGRMKNTESYVVTAKPNNTFDHKDAIIKVIVSPLSGSDTTYYYSVANNPLMFNEDNTVFSLPWKDIVKSPSSVTTEIIAIETVPPEPPKVTISESLTNVKSNKPDNGEMLLDSIYELRTDSGYDFMNGVTIKVDGKEEHFHPDSTVNIFTENNTVFNIKWSLYAKENSFIHVKSEGKPVKEQPTECLLRYTRNGVYYGIGNNKIVPKDFVLRVSSVENGGLLFTEDTPIVVTYKQLDGDKVYTYTPKTHPKNYKHFSGHPENTWYECDIALGEHWEYPTEIFVEGYATRMIDNGVTEGDKETWGWWANSYKDGIKTPSFNVNTGNVVEMTPMDEFTVYNDTEIEIEMLRDKDYKRTFFKYSPATHPTYFNEKGVFMIEAKEIWDDSIQGIVKGTLNWDYRDADFIFISDTATHNITEPQIAYNDDIIVTANSGYNFDRSSKIVVKLTDRYDVVKEVVYTPTSHPTMFTSSTATVNLASEWLRVNLVEMTVTASKDKDSQGDVTYYHELYNVTSDRENGKKYASTTEVTLTATAGHTFQSSIDVVYLRQRHPAKRLTFHPAEPDHAMYFNKDKTVFTHSIDDVEIPDPTEPVDVWDVVSVEYQAEAKEVYEGDTDDVIDGLTTTFLNVYNANDSVLSNITNQRWLVTADKFYDFGDYIKAVYKYPLFIDKQNISIGKTKVKLGHNTTKTDSQYFLNSRIKFHLGTIKIDESYKNVYDYKDAQCLLHLPYSEPLTIDPTYVIGQELDVWYYLDAYTGDTTMVAYSTKNGNNIALQEDIQVAYNIPFASQRYNDTYGRVGKYIPNKVSKVFIEVIRPTPYDTDTIQGKEGKEVKPLKEFSGYVEVRDIKLDTLAMEVEQDKIKQLLASGVYVR